MQKIIAVTFDVADQKCKMYNALEWHNFIADTRERLCPDWDDNVLGVDDLLETAYGDEFWWELTPSTKNVYTVAFDLRSEEFVICEDDNEVDFIMEMAADSGDEEEIFWAE